MSAQRIAARVERDGTVTVRDQPYPPGTEVEVIVLPRVAALDGKYPLRGVAYRFDDPFSPAASEDWDAVGAG